MEGFITRAFEIKPERTTRDKVRTGIGQCAYHKLSGFDTYLALFRTYADEVEKMLQFLPWLGLVKYDERGRMTVIQGNIF